MIRNVLQFIDTIQSNIKFIGISTLKNVTLK